MGGIYLSIDDHLQKRSPNYLLKVELEPGYRVTYRFDEARQLHLLTKVTLNRPH